MDLLEDLPTDIQINAVIINNSKRWVQAQKVLFLAGFILFSALTYWLLSQKPNVEMHLRIKAGAVSLSKFRMPDDQELLFKDIQVSDFKISNPGNCLETFAVDTSVPMSVSSAKIQNIECQGEIFISTNEDGFNTASDVNTELRLLLDKSSTINYEIYPHGAPCQMVLHLRKLAIETDDSIKIEKKVNADSVYFINGTGKSSIVNGELIIGKLNNPLKIISLLKDSDLKIESNSEMYLTNFLLNNKKGIELTFNGPLRYIKMDGNHITVNNIEWYWHYYRMALTVFVVGIVVVFIIYLKKWK